MLLTKRVINEIILRGGGGGVVQAYHFGKKYFELGFFWILGPKFFGDLNQKSGADSMCKIHIYIDSETFRKIH